jgi:hypothetical protein
MATKIKVDGRDESSKLDVTRKAETALCRFFSETMG